jgi:anti-sigma factor RsiW
MSQPARARATACLPRLVSVRSLWTSLRGIEAVLDFAPALAYAGDADFPLQGGSVAVFLDRKAAAFVFSRRLHTISLFVFVAEGLPWPSRGATELASHDAFARTSRGFNTLLWRNGDLGYAAVSDVSEPELLDLATRIEAAR